MLFERCKPHWKWIKWDWVSLLDVMINNDLHLNRVYRWSYHRSSKYCHCLLFSIWVQNSCRAELWPGSAVHVDPCTASFDANSCSRHANFDVAAADGIDSRTVFANIAEIPLDIVSDRALTCCSCCACFPFWKVIFSFYNFNLQWQKKEEVVKMKGTC